jgi:hypothetical protein
LRLRLGESRHNVLAGAHHVNSKRRFRPVHRGKSLRFRKSWSHSSCAIARPCGNAGIAIANPARTEAAIHAFLCGFGRSSFGLSLRKAAQPPSDCYRWFPYPSAHRSGTGACCRSMAVSTARTFACSRPPRTIPGRWRGGDPRRGENKRSNRSRRACFRHSSIASRTVQRTSVCKLVLTAEMHAVSVGRA